jgi:glucosamine--fructose-6-phosphate aminotransferase (isomerizing)
MSGIVGYAGNGNGAKEILLDGLRALEYRGYDSAGIAMVRKSKLIVRKESGKLRALEAKVTSSDFDGPIGIGHTRWATHGAPTRDNAHPHLSSDGKIAVVHNGIIENYRDLKDELIRKNGIVFVSETDSEVIAQLIGLNYKGDLKEAVRKTSLRLKGAYTIAVICADDPERIIATRKNAPLVAGMCDEGAILASDIPALLKHTRDVYMIEDGEIVIITNKGVEIYDEEHTRINRMRLRIKGEVYPSGKNGHEHFMYKEIKEQPDSIRELLVSLVDRNGILKPGTLEFLKNTIDRIENIYIVGCGTASHAGLTGKSFIEKFTKIKCEACISSEFRYQEPILSENSLCLFISQSGETGDTLEALREAKRKGAITLSIINTVYSSAARESDHAIFMSSGPEIAVASTKTYTAQITSLYLIALNLGFLRGTVKKAEAKRLFDELSGVPELIEDVFKREDKIKELAKKHYKKDKIFYSGRGLDVATAYEASLKLKEISYINSYSIAAGELKYGAIALITKDILFIMLATQSKLIGKMLSSMEEVKARQAQVIAVVKDGDKKVTEAADDVFFIPDCPDDLSPIISAVAFQIFAYHVAKLRGREIDQPRNLAKAITVE